MDGTGQSILGKVSSLVEQGLVRQQLKLQQREVPRELGGRGVGGVSQDGQDAHGWDPELLKAEVQHELAQADRNKRSCTWPGLGFQPSSLVGLLRSSSSSQGWGLFRIELTLL
ncbi:hypothetical protein HaLaN_27864, partial [Haematococcus lacustris]